MNIFSKKEIIITINNNINSKVVFIVIFFLASFQTFSQNYKTVKAKNGDGIYSVLRDNQIPMSYIDEFIELNSNKLKDSRELKIGETYKLPPIANKTEGNEVKADQKTQIGKVKPTKRFKIFGEEYQDVEIESTELAGAVYYLVAGHGGPDPGAVGNYKGKTLCEDEYAYDITLRLARNLVAHGALVYMITRDNNDGIRDGWYLPPDKDEKCYPNLTIPSSHTPRLRQRKDAVNKLYIKHKGQYQRMIEIHIDSRSKGEKIDVFFYHDKRSSSGKILAENLRNVFDAKYNEHQPGRGYHGTVSQRNLYVLKYTYPVATFIELGNINHHRDLLRFILVDNRQALANWLSEGIIVDFQKH